MASATPKDDLLQRYKKAEILLENAIPEYEKYGYEMFAKNFRVLISLVDYALTFANDETIEIIVENLERFTPKMTNATSMREVVRMNSFFFFFTEALEKRAFSENRSLTEAMKEVKEQVMKLIEQEVRINKLEQNLPKNGVALRLEVKQLNNIYENISRILDPLNEEWLFLIHNFFEFHLKSVEKFFNEFPYHQKTDDIHELEETFNQMKRTTDEFWNISPIDSEEKVDFSIERSLFLSPIKKCFDKISTKIGFYHSF